MSRKRPKHVIRASRRNRVTSVTDPRAIVRPDNTAAAQPSKPHPGFPEPKFKLEPPKAPKPVTTPTGVPLPTQIRQSVPIATKADVDAVLDLIQALTAKVADYSARLSILEHRPAVLNPPKVDKLQQVRDDIETWLKSLPLGMWVSTGMVARNLGAEDEKGVAMYRRQVERLAQLGTLDKEGGGTTGSTAQFRLKREFHPDYTLGDEKFVD